MIDVALVLFIGLVFLFFWRGVFWWRFGGQWLEYANYCCLLYLLLLVILVTVSVELTLDALAAHGRKSWGQLPGYFQPIVLSVPPVVVITYLACIALTISHVNKIRLNQSVHMHDRVVQIVSLPAVYSVMALSSMARMYHVVTVGIEDSARDTPEYKVSLQSSLNRSQTSFWVGDLYEAWALYQFGKLTLELLEASFARLGASRNADERNKANGLLVAFGAVDSLAWVGIMAFLVVCIAHSGWSLWLLTFANTNNSSDALQQSESMFAAAGMLASGAAIWNIHTVESTFHQYLESYGPFSKFITVKIIVSFAFFQRGAIHVLLAVQDTLPGLASNLLRHFPFIGAIINLPPDQFEIFYACLLCFECLLVAVMHAWAWRANEKWYNDGASGESKALLSA